MKTPEFSRPERLDAIGADAREVAVEADADERRKLAGRFGVPSIERLAGQFTLHRETTGVRVRGQVSAAVTQACSVSGEPMAAAVDEPVDLLFMAMPSDSGDEVELGDDSIDVVFHEGGAIDLGETAAETMMLALDPFPRGPGATAALEDAGVTGEGEAGPFSGLAALLKKG